MPCTKSETIPQQTKIKKTNKNHPNKQKTSKQLQQKQWQQQQQQQKSKTPKETRMEAALESFLLQTSAFLHFFPLFPQNVFFSCRCDFFALLWNYFQIPASQDCIKVKLLLFLSLYAPKSLNIGPVWRLIQFLGGPEVLEAVYVTVPVLRSGHTKQGFTWVWQLKFARLTEFQGGWDWKEIVPAHTGPPGGGCSGLFSDGFWIFLKMENVQTLWATCADTQKLLC